MLFILLKSSACLAIFIVFYKLFLERETMHHFKRFYLLAALVVSFTIPFITFVKYVEPSLDFGNADSYAGIPHYTPADMPVAEITEPKNYLPIILWSIYGLGVILFGLKFGLNLLRIISKINKNEKQKQGRFITVLLKDLISPHTFFSYIFLNKTKFETKAIPEEVLLHEAAHAKQKHSLDVLFIELLQVIFWFNPLLYFIKRDIKLNHEFLADEAVLKHGIDSSTYQAMLLVFSSSTAEPELANAINYSLIKKRFNIMKKQTSRKAVWLRSLLVLPLLGGLLFSFSSIKEVEKEILSEIKFETPEKKSESEGLSTKEKNTNPILEITQNPLHFKLNGKPTSLADLKADFKKSTDNKKSNLRIEAKGAVDFDLLKEIMTIISKDYLLKIELAEEAYIENKTDYSVKSNQETLLIINGIVCDQCELNLSKKGIEGMVLSTTTGEQISSFKFKIPGKSAVTIKGNVLNKNTVKLLDGVSMGTIIELSDINTTNKQKLPSVKIKIVDKMSKSYSDSPVVQNGEKSSLPPPPPPPAPVEEYMKMKGKAEKSGLPPQPPVSPEPPKPPKPVSTKKHIKNMAAKGANFFFDGEPISSEKAIELAKSNQMINISSHINNGKSTVHLSTKPITVINGKASIKEHKVQALKAHEQALKAQKQAMIEHNKKAIEENTRLINTKKEALEQTRLALEERNRMIHYNRKPLAQQFAGMEANGGEFYYEGEKISEAKAITLIKENTKLNVSMHNNNGKSTVHLSKKGIEIINGELVNNK